MSLVQGGGAGPSGRGPDEPREAPDGLREMPDDSREAPDGLRDARPGAARHVPIDDAEDGAAEDGAHRVVARFFEAFAQSDAARMAACYHPMASYSSPVFPDLRGALPGRMWALALGGAQALRLEWAVAFADARKAQVTWRAQWRQGRRARRLEGVSTLTVWDGVIVRQVDEFRFARWATQALGLRGLLLAWLPPVRRAAQRRARAALEAFAPGDAAQPHPDDGGRPEPRA